MERFGKIVLMNLPTTRSRLATSKSKTVNIRHVFEDETKFKKNDLSVLDPAKYRDRFLDFCKK